VGIGDDVALCRLPKDLCQPDDRNLLGGDEIAQHHPRANTGELIDVAHEEHLGLWWDRFEERVRQKEIEHRGLIYHEGLCLQGMVLVMPELHPSRVESQHPVDGFGFHAGQLRKTLGGTPCWGSQQNAFAHGPPQRDNGTRGLYNEF
jgi:hypothetical protein